MSFTSMLFLMIGSFLSIIMSIYELMMDKCYMIEWDILSINSSSIVVTYIFDWMSMMFLGFVMFISSMVLYYSGEYMSGCKEINRFMYLVLAFVGSMGIFILSPNLISILLGWDGLGLVSYVLVIYYQNEKCANAGMLTVLSNRIGDVAILLSIGLMLSLGGWNFVIYSYYLSDEMYLLMKFLFVLAAMTKSAQIPFSAWLPAAMAAPTPVSALVHSSTLVTAGVYLMIRFSPSLLNSEVQIFLLLISCLTMFMSGLGANFEYDLKKIIALSTLSQLGIMLSITAMGLSDLAFFHLLTHALFKALLFMCAGVIIHNMKEFQDIRCMGVLSKFMPFTSMMMNLSNLALCGAPFLAGFYFKDLILEVAFMSHINMLSFFLYVLSTGLTVSYTFRLIYYSLVGNLNLGSLSNINDESRMMTSPMVILGSGSVFGGALLSWMIFPEVYLIFMSFYMKMLVLILSIVGGIFGYMMNMMSLSYGLMSLYMYESSFFGGLMWNMPFLSTLKFNYGSLKTGKYYLMLSDKGWSELLGGQGFFYFLMKGSGFYQVFQDNTIKIIMKIFLLGLMILFFMLV
uniref:NADH-ubiquinone oxidoreductase chain 5 n=1 Tax=Shinkaia crosnieri TaxID=480484 RepID=B3TZD1_SHICR|nr:NADH dehydrogenase subunit 5 [Shinkaia crosnieri]